ncbi:hypothetical protein CEXT_671831 [Caerostris extrusa]|uniref:Uncharacterized protein n=1 Tax=Caerostris extrusa TaxID=172846 RepID=A0AAV4V7L4_CAEEX|nr:hypothetical protein CEXT_671831 [Caerostris extrusa]
MKLENASEIKFDAIESDLQMKARNLRYAPSCPREAQEKSGAAVKRRLCLGGEEPVTGPQKRGPHKSRGIARPFPRPLDTRR